MVTSSFNARLKLRDTLSTLYFTRYFGTCKYILVLYKGIFVNLQGILLLYRGILVIY